MTWEGGGGGGHLQVIGPRCSEEEELLHGGHFDLNVQLSNSSL